MSITYVCDWCGEKIEHGMMVSIEADGYVPSDRHRGWDSEDYRLGHYHTDNGSPSCYDHALEQIEFALDAAPSLERVPSISGQAVAARRRKHRKA